MVIFGMMFNAATIFEITSQLEFEQCALKIYGYQFRNNPVYHKFCRYLGKTEKNVSALQEIPFLPIDFFKSKNVVSGVAKPEMVFTSSGTTGSITSFHYVTNVQLYRQSYLQGFQYFYGLVSEYCILALLPSYLERQGSSLVYMVDDLIKRSGHPESGFQLNDLDSLTKKLLKLDAAGTKILLIGVSFALLELVEIFQFNLKNTIIMETGGMKGRRKEMIREELHGLLKEGFGVSRIHSEYGMTELLSQAYSEGDGIFKTPPWMQVRIRDTEDPLTPQDRNKTGGINIIDLANLNSCAFIATQDLGKMQADGRFEILGRFDNSDIRGCNLMVL
ncbi:MAG: acyl transferase [Maribacter sp.]|nr:acyl transferase [Maribacter sp.]